MKFTLALCAALLFVVLAKDEDECVPGQTKMDNCNHCRCFYMEKWACTRKACPKKRECVPGQTKMDNCNHCRCFYMEKWACTRKACPKQRDIHVEET